MRICDLIKDQETYHAELAHTVLETVRVMVERSIGAVPVIHSGELVGIFSERDLMRRVVAEGRDPQGHVSRRGDDRRPLGGGHGGRPGNLHDPDAPSRLPAPAGLS